VCDHALAWYDNIPVFSYVMLRGKCRYCKAGISLQYPVVELMTAVVFGVIGIVASNGGWSDVVIGALTAGIFAAMIVVFVYDFKYMEVPMMIIYIAVALAIVILLMQDKFGDTTIGDVSLWSTMLFQHGLAGFFCFGFFYGLSFISDERWMGYGDGYIALVIGLLLGPLAAFIAIMIAVTSGAMIGSLQMAYRGASLKTAIPFGPYLISGMFAAYCILHFQPEIMTILW